MNSVLHSSKADPSAAVDAQLSDAKRSDSQEPATTDDFPALRAIVEGTAGSTGEEFFRNLVRHLAAAIDAHHAFVAEFADVNSRVRTLAYWAQDHIRENQEWDLAGTPCQDVLRGSICHHPVGVKDLFPFDRDLLEMGIESYLGVPLCDATGGVLGHLAVFDERPMPAEPRRLYTFRIFAARAAAELTRFARSEKLALRERTAFPRSVRGGADCLRPGGPRVTLHVASRGRGSRILGLTSDDVVGTLGTSLVANTPDAQPPCPRSIGVHQPRHGYARG